MTITNIGTHRLDVVLNASLFWLAGTKGYFDEPGSVGHAAWGFIAGRLGGSTGIVLMVAFAVYQLTYTKSANETPDRIGDIAEFVTGFLLGLPA